MSRSFSANAGSFERLNVRWRCGWRSCSAQIRCTELSEMPAWLAIARPVQWVASPGGSAQVIATTRATVASGNGGVPGGRVLSRSRPLTPCSANRRCQRHTAGRLTLARLATSATGSRPADSSTISARCTCLRRWLRSPTIASSRARSSSLTITETSCAMPELGTGAEQCESFVVISALGFHASQAQRLQQGEVLVPARIPFDRADDGEAQLAIEGRSLKIMGFQHHLLTPARHRLLLDGAHEPGAVALSAHLSRDEKMAD